MDNLQEIRTYAGTLRLVHTKNELGKLIHTAVTGNASYVTFLHDTLDDEIKYLQNKANEKYIKEAGFPYPKYLKDFDLNFCQSITTVNFFTLLFTNLSMYKIYKSLVSIC